MLAALSTRRGSVIALAVLLAAAALLVYLAPAERSLGNGIKIVYIHVALIGTGMTGLAAAGVLALAILLTGRATLAPLLQAVAVTGGGFFAAGTLTSVFAAQINWGAVFWAEPRMTASFQVLAIALIVLLVTRFGLPLRATAALHLLPAFFLFRLLTIATRVLHPENPIGRSGSLKIQMTFVGLYAICCVAAWLLMARLRRSHAAPYPCAWSAAGHRKRIEERMR